MTNFKLILFFLFSFNLSSAFSQPRMNFTTMEHVYQDWLDKRVFDGLKCDTMYYKESIKPEIIDSTIKILLERKSFPISELYMGDKDKPFRITQAEQTYLINELKKLKEFKWPPKMFPLSQKVKPGDLSKVFAKTGSYPQGKLNMCSVYGFSKPIYIRNKTICLYLQEEQFKETYYKLTFGFLKMYEGEWQEYADVFVNFGKAIQEEVKEDVKKSIQYNPSFKSEQLDVLAKKIFFALKNNQLDTLISLIPPSYEIVAIRRRTRGLPPPSEELLVRLRGAEPINTSKLTDYLQGVIKTAFGENANLTKATYINFEKHEEEIALSLSEDAKPFINTSLDIFVNFENRNFVIKIPEIYSLKGALRISPALTISEINR